MLLKLTILVVGSRSQIFAKCINYFVTMAIAALRSRRQNNLRQDRKTVDRKQPAHVSPVS